MHMGDEEQVVKDIGIHWYDILVDCLEGGRMHGMCVWCEDQVFNTSQNNSVKILPQFGKLKRDDIEIWVNIGHDSEHVHIFLSIDLDDSPKIKYFETEITKILESHRMIFTTVRRAEDGTISDEKVHESKGVFDSYIRPDYLNDDELKVQLWHYCDSTCPEHVGSGVRRSFRQLEEYKSILEKILLIPPMLL